MKEYLNELINLRHVLHRNPEVSCEEKYTAQRISEFLTENTSVEIHSGIGGNGLAAIFKGKNPGKTVLARCELDALPIKENSKTEYSSIVENVSHLCGHDGHMAILIGVALKIQQNPPEKGTVILFYQGAEETGQGAEAALKHSFFDHFIPDTVIALHNIPGFKKGTVITSDSFFASSSTGICVDFKGKTSHAAEPEKGINPAKALSEVISGFIDIPKKITNFSLVTAVGATLGNGAYGTSAGDAQFKATLRSYSGQDMEKIKHYGEKLVSELAQKHGLEFEVSYHEFFPATVNDPAVNSLIRESAIENSLEIKKLDAPFRWSEDFGYFTSRFSGGMFGLGSGEDQPPLHHEDYDFPDEIIESGVNMFVSIIRKVLD
ncbi:MAG: amidohydrolase [Deltaproteobacteria bacterium]|nr:amidohydrolase [Deltaproteobacteria bacterium]